MEQCEASIMTIKVESNTCVNEEMTAELFPKHLGCGLWANLKMYLT